MELAQTSVTQISGIKKWSKIVPLQKTECAQYILQHISSNGSQIAFSNYDKSKDKHQPIVYNDIHDKFGKHLVLCQMNESGEIIIFVLENGDIIKWNVSATAQTTNEITKIPSVPIVSSSHTRQEYDTIRISECGKSVLVLLKNKKNGQTNNVWIYNETVRKWFNTQYTNEIINDGFKHYKYYNNAWYVIDIGSDTSMSYELNLSIHKLCVIMDDEMSSLNTNEDVLVYTDCELCIDLSHIKQYLTNKIHKILWDLDRKLIILLFDEFLIWISIANDISNPLYILSLIPTPNMKFRDMIFMCNGMMAVAITNHGCLTFYQRLSEKPIYLNYHKNNTNENLFKVDWKKMSQLNFNNSFTLHSINESEMYLSNGRTIIHYNIGNMHFKYFAYNSLAFIRSNGCIQQKLAENELNAIRIILCFEIEKVLKSDETNKRFMETLLWFTKCESKSVKYNDMWQCLFLNLLQNKQKLLKKENMVKIIKICSNYFGLISKCLKAEINAFYDEIEQMIERNVEDIWKFDWKNIFCADYDNQNKTKLYKILCTIVFLFMFESPTKILNKQIDNLIDILWRISKLNENHSSTVEPVHIKSENNKMSKVQKLKKWLDLQLTKIEQIKPDSTNKEFASIFWKKISENQQQLISDSNSQNGNIIYKLIEIICANAENLQTDIKHKIRALPMFSMYYNGKREEYYDSEIEFEERKNETCSEKQTESPKIEAKESIVTSIVSSHNLNTNESIQTANSEHICSENNEKMAENSEINLEYIARYVPEKYIIDKLANKLTKQELMQLFATKMHLKNDTNNDSKCIEHKTKKWKLIEYSKDNKVIENQELSSKMKKKIRKYLRKKNKLLQMLQMRQKTKPVKSESETQLQNAEVNNEEEKPIEIEQKQDIPTVDTNNNVTNDLILTETITNDISFIINDHIPTEDENQNKYELNIETFDCIYIPSSRTSCTQTQPSDIIIDRTQTKANTNWFVSPLLAATQNTKTSETKLQNTELKEQKPETTNLNTEGNKDSEIMTSAEDSAFVSVPVIGARTAGLSYIDPSMKINKDTLQLKFPATHEFKTELPSIDDHKESYPEKDGKNSLLQSQCSLMMHSFAASTLSNEKNINTNMDLGDFEHEIAMMDAQLCTLSSLCNNIQNNYYKMNTKLDANKQTYQNTNINAIGNNNGVSQIGTVEAWALLDSIQENLDSIDKEMNVMNKNETRKQQLTNLKSKNGKRAKKRKKRYQLTKNLEQQTNLLNQIYDKLL